MFLQEKPICALVDTKNPAHLNRILASFHGGTQDHHIDRHAQKTSQKGVFGNGDELAFLFRVFRLVGNFSHLTPDEGGPFFLAPLVKFFIPLAETALVDVEIIDGRIVTDLLID